VSLRVRGGPSAPRSVRVALAGLLDGRLSKEQLSDAELVVSELVTNSVQHAAVGDGQIIGVDLLLLRDRLRLSVVDPGSSLLPRLVRGDGACRLGLALVAELSTSCGVARDGAGVTRVWSELALTDASEPATADA
jgi:anti-sigma regulatory factor (Ser/Thr protein kinase)